MSSSLDDQPRLPGLGSHQGQERLVVAPQSSSRMTAPRRLTEPARVYRSPLSSLPELPPRVVSDQAILPMQSTSRQVLRGAPLLAGGPDLHPMLVPLPSILVPLASTLSMPPVTGLDEKGSHARDLLSIGLPLGEGTPEETPPSVALLSEPPFSQPLETPLVVLQAGQPDVSTEQGTLSLAGGHSSAIEKSQPLMQSQVQAHTQGPRAREERTESELPTSLQPEGQKASPGQNTPNRRSQTEGLEPPSGRPQGMPIARPVVGQAGTAESIRETRTTPPSPVTVSERAPRGPVKGPGDTLRSTGQSREGQSPGEVQPSLLPSSSGVGVEARAVRPEAWGSPPSDRRVEPGPDSRNRVFGTDSAQPEVPSRPETLTVPLSDPLPPLAQARLMETHVEHITAPRLREQAPDVQTLLDAPDSEGPQPLSRPAALGTPPRAPSLRQSQEPDPKALRDELERLPPPPPERSAATPLKPELPMRLSNPGLLSPLVFVPALSEVPPMRENQGLEPKPQTPQGELERLPPPPPERSAPTLKPELPGSLSNPGLLSPLVLLPSFSENPPTHENQGLEPKPQTPQGVLERLPLPPLEQAASTPLTQPLDLPLPSERSVCSDSTERSSPSPDIRDKVDPAQSGWMPRARGTERPRASALSRPEPRPRAVLVEVPELSDNPSVGGTSDGLVEPSPPVPVLPRFQEQETAATGMEHLVSAGPPPPETKHTQVEVSLPQPKPLPRAQTVLRSEPQAPPTPQPMPGSDPVPTVKPSEDPRGGKAPLPLPLPGVETPRPEDSSTSSPKSPVPLEPSSGSPRPVVRTGLEPTQAPSDWETLARALAAKLGVSLEGGVKSSPSPLPSRPESLEESPQAPSTGPLPEAELPLPTARPLRHRRRAAVLPQRQPFMLRAPVKSTQDTQAGTLEPPGWKRTAPSLKTDPQPLPSGPRPRRGAVTSRPTHLSKSPSPQGPRPGQHRSAPKPEGGIPIQVLAQPLPEPSSDASLTLKPESKPQTVVQVSSPTPSLPKARGKTQTTGTQSPKTSPTSSPDDGRSTPGSTSTQTTAPRKSTLSTKDSSPVVRKPTTAPDPDTQDLEEALSDAGLANDLTARTRIQYLKKNVSLDELVAIHQHLESLSPRRRQGRLEELIEARKRNRKEDLNLDMPSNVSQDDRRDAVKFLEELMRENDMGDQPEPSEASSSKTVQTLDRSDLAEVAFELRWRIRQQERWEVEAW